MNFTRTSSRFLSPALAGLAFFALSGCEPAKSVLLETPQGAAANSNGVPNQGKYGVHSITITTTDSSLVTGQQTQATAVPRDAQGNPVTGVTVSWSISPTAVATISSTGLITAGTTSGTATVSATADGTTRSMTITVDTTATQPSPSASPSTISITASASTIKIGEVAQLSGVVKDSTGTTISTVPIQWSSSPTSVATTTTTNSTDGAVTGRGAGQATVYATADTIVRQVTITVVDTATTTSTTTTTTTQGAYYVSPTGSDANAGTEASPWRTLAYALPRLRAGQTLYLRGGTYQENLKNPAIQPGLATSRITVAAYPGERPVIVGLLWLTRPSYWTLDGINVTWNTANLSTEHMVKMVNGIGWIYQNSELWGARSFADLLVTGNVTGEPANWTVRQNCVHDTYPSNSVSQDHNMYINTGITAGAGLIERNVIFNAPNGENVKLGFGRSAPQPGDGTANVTVRYNTMYSSLKPMLVSDESHTNRIERNIIVNSGSSTNYAIRAYLLSGTDNVFHDNVFYGFTTLQYADAGYTSLTDGGGNKFPLDPKFNGAGCGMFKPADTAAQAYGRFAP